MPLSSDIAAAVPDRRRKGRTRAGLVAAVVLALAAAVPAATSVARTSGVITDLAWSQPYARYGQNLWATYNANGNATVTFSIVNSRGDRVRDLGDGVPEGAGAHAVDWDGYSDAALRVRDGVYRLVLDSVDAGGAKASVSAPIEIDTHPPSIRFATSRLGRGSTLVAQLRDGVTGVSGASLLVGNHTVAHGSGVSTQLTYRPRGGWRPGRYTVSVRAGDRAGNWSYASRTFSVGH